MIPKVWGQLLNEATAEVVKRFHFNSDRDTNRLALHHTLGPGPNQAAPGSILNYSMRLGDTLTSARSDENKWLKLCNGQALSKMAYPELFAVIGTTYGSTSTTFNLPDLRDRGAVGASGTKALGSTGGAASVVIGTANLPPHTHDIGHDHGNTNLPITNISDVPTSGSGIRTTKVGTVGSAPSGSTTTNTAINVPAFAGNSGNGGFANTALPTQNPYVALNVFMRVK